MLRRANAKLTPTSDWKRWFAWHPVRILYEIDEHPGKSWADSGNHAWLRWVERRWIPPYAHDKGCWEYRKIGGA